MNATPETFAATMDALEQTALRVKAERDEAMALLLESRLYTNNEPFNGRVRAFLERVKRG